MRDGKISCLCLQMSLDNSDPPYLSKYPTLLLSGYLCVRILFNCNFSTISSHRQESQLDPVAKFRIYQLVFIYTLIFKSQ